MNTSRLLTPDDLRKEAWVDVVPTAGHATVHTDRGRNFRITLNQDTLVSFKGEGKNILLKVTQGGAGGWTLTPENTGNVSSFSPYIAVEGSTYLRVYFDEGDGGWNLDDTYAPASASGGEAFPIGSIFISAVATDPAELLGYGTWSAIGAGRVLIGQDTGDSDFNSLGETGGAKTVQSVGVNSAPAFTGAALGTHAHAAGTLVPSAHAGSAVQDHAAHTHSVTSNVAVGDHAAHTHTFTASATQATPDLVTSNVTGTGVAPSGTTGNPGATLTHSVTNNAVTSGNPSATLTHSVTQPNAHTMSGSSEAVSAGTPAGTVAAPTFTGGLTSVVQPYLTCKFWQRTA